ncbi:MAG TPA: hypothetical protein VFE30_16205 [Anaeromyxobacteraceae bacterium]|jgi:hypothetical protein|nr:hypothetical protein [Anaeromyxobacteraceae bacterium]
MSMKPCKECKKEISSEAKVCPNCGKKSPTQSGGAKVVGFIIGILFFIWLFGHIGGNATPSGTAASNAQEPARPAARTAGMEVDNRRLWQDYEANEVAADNVYRGKTLKVRGTVSSVDKDFMDNIVVHLASPNEFMNTMATVQKAEARQAAQLSKGQRISLICEGKGRVMGSPSLDDCTFAQ